MTNRLAREVGDVVAGVAPLGSKAEPVPERERCAERLVELAEAGDRILVMGARDDTLTVFAEGLLEKLNRR